MSRALRNLSRCFLSDNSDARRRSREIDAMLKRDFRIPVVIILTGSGKSGKSTFLKQMRFINGAEYSHEEVLKFRQAIYDDIIQGMRVLVQERNKLGIPLQISANEKHEMLFSSHSWIKLEPCTFQPYAEAIDSLWKDSGIQEAHRRRSNYQLYESVKYFFDNINRIGQLNYLPYNQDILYAHDYIGQRYFVLRDIPYTVAEVTVCNYILRKTVGCYGYNTPFFYIVGCSDYDQTVFEDNSLSDSLKDFERICNQLSNYTTVPLYSSLTKWICWQEKYRLQISESIFLSSKVILTGWRMCKNSWFKAFRRGKGIISGRFSIT